MDEYQLHEKGNSYYKLENFDGSIEYYTMAIELNPNILETYFNRALAYTRKQMYDKAIEDLNKVIELNPNLAEAYYTRGLVYEYKEEYDKAMEDYNRALETDKDYSKAGEQREKVLLKKQRILYEKPELGLKVIKRGGKVSLESENEDCVYSVYEKGEILTGGVWDYFNIPLLLLDKKEDILIIGLGGGTTARQYLKFFNAHIDGVEINEEVVDIAKRFFNIQNDNVKIHVEDGSVFMNKSKKRYDAIILDAFIGDTIPKHLTTIEFLSSLRNHITRDGLVVINTTIGDEDSIVSESIGNKLSTLFKNVFRLDYQSNRLIFAFAKDVKFEDILDTLKGKKHRKLQNVIDDSVGWLNPFVLGRTLNLENEKEVKKGRKRTTGHSIGANGEVVCSGR